MVTCTPADTGVVELRERVLAELGAAMPAANLAAARACGRRLLTALPSRRLAENKVMVAFGGGKDSAYTLAFVRAMQLLLFAEHGETFRLRVATNRHAGMPKAVMHNIDRPYRALGLFGDPDCELLLVDGNEISPFDVDLPQRPAVIQRNRLDILMAGHRTHADGRPTFCNACNLSVVNSLGLAASHGESADVIITGDSQREQRQYALWVARLARTLNPSLGPAGPNLGGLLARIDGLAGTYFGDLYGSPDAPEVATRRVHHDVSDELRFFSIYDDTEYASGDHLELLTGFLGFEFDDLAFSFTESDCGNPALMAHLRGLKCEHLYQRDYAEGLVEYVDFATGLMRSKDFPPALIAQISARYADVGRMRRQAEEYAWQTFGFTETELVCMLYSPFAGGGAGLERYLSRERPGLLGRLAEFSELLAGTGVPAEEPATELELLSGLGIDQLRVLYRSPLTGSTGGTTDVIATALVGDPHQAVIRTRFTMNGPVVSERISGR